MILVSHIPFLKGQLAYDGEAQVRGHFVQGQPRAPCLQGNHVHVLTVDHLEGADVSASRWEVKTASSIYVPLRALVCECHVYDSDLYECLLQQLIM